VTTFDRYIFSEWVKTFLLAMGLTLGLLLMEDMYDDLPDLLVYGASIMDVAWYYLVLVPSFLPIVLPLALMISVLFSLGNLHRNNEIIAMRACGLSLYKLTRSLWTMGIAFTFLLFYLNAQLVPWSVEQSRKIWDNYAFAEQLTQKDEENVGLIYNLSFYNHKEKRLWFMNRFSEYNYRGYGITVSILDGNRREITRLLANEGYYDDLDGNWVFINGRETIFDSEQGDPIRSLSFKRKNLPYLSEEPALMNSLEKRPKDLSFFQLGKILDKISAKDDPRVNGYAVRYHSILANPFSCLIVMGLAIPYAVAGVRVNPMVGVSKSFGLFLAYYFMSSFCTLLGERQIIEPFQAAWLPNVLMFFFALFIYRKAI